MGVVVYLNSFMFNQFLWTRHVKRPSVHTPNSVLSWLICSVSCNKVLYNITSFLGRFSVEALLYCVSLCLRLYFMLLALFLGGLQSHLLPGLWVIQLGDPGRGFCWLSRASLQSTLLCSPVHAVIGTCCGFSVLVRRRVL